MKTKQIIKFIFYPLVLLRRKYILKRNARWAEENPKALANYFYKQMSGRNINWISPKDLSEKINWMKFYTDTSLWTRLADKYLVREYVESKGLGHILPKLYGVWKDANDIDFSILPDKFVLKTNHGCSTVLLVKEKSELDIEQTRQKLNEWLKIQYGKSTVEPHYLSIKPLLLAEEYLETKDKYGLVDYKLFTIHGKTELVMACVNRVIGVGSTITLYDKEWNYVPERMNPKLYKSNVEVVEKPINFELMKKYAGVLCENFPIVRMDFYEVNGKIYFGEMTFTPKGGYCSTLSDAEQYRLGQMINLPTAE